MQNYWALTNLFLYGYHSRKIKAKSDQDAWKQAKKWYKKYIKLYPDSQHTLVVLKKVTEKK